MAPDKECTPCSPHSAGLSTVGASGVTARPPACPHGGSEGQSGLSSLRLQAPLLTPQPLNSLCKSLRNKLGRQEERQLFPAKMGSPGSQQP